MSILQSDLGTFFLETARLEELPLVTNILDECATWL